MTNEEQYTIDNTPFRVNIDEPSPGPSGDRLRKWNDLKLNIDRQKTIGDIEYDDSILVEYLTHGSTEKVWAVCIQCGKGRWVRYQQYHDLCKSCSQSGERCYMFGKHHSEESCKKMSDAKSGENNPNYGRTGEKHPLFGKTPSKETRIKMSCAHQGISVEEFPGFVTEEHNLFRRSTDYAKWRTAVFERDNYTCQECGVHGGVELEAHHITPFHIHPEPEQSLNIDNGITLCKSCHDKTKRHEDEFYNKYTAIVKSNYGFKDDFLSSSAILEGLKKQNKPCQTTLFNY